jgi:N-acetylneuraminic acid mutarotase/pimeloyl-ACP methyl ester carboxylesterase
MADGRVLVSGGYTSSGTPTATAEVYDPSTGEWTYTAQAMNVARAGHTTALLSDGNVLIIGGTTTSNTKTSSVELFNPSTGTFAQLSSLSSANGAGPGHAFNVGNDKIVYIYRSDSVADVETFNYATKLWTQSNATVPSGGWGPAMALLNDGRIFVCGGYFQASDASIYAPATDSWQILMPMTQGRQNQTATTLLSGKIFIASGVNTGVDGAYPVATTEIYDLTAQPSGATVAGPNISGPGPEGAGMVSVLMPNGNVFMTGGGYAPGYGTSALALANGAVYDPIAATITSAGVMNVSRHDHTMTVLSSGLVLIVGGVTDALNALTPVTELFGYGNFPTQPTTFTQTGSMVIPRASAQAVTLNNGQVLITGGGLSDGGVTDTAELYDPATGLFSLTTNNMTSPRVYHSASLLPDGRVIICGGQDGSSPTALASTDIYDPSTNAFTAGPPMSTGHDLHRSLALTDGHIIVISGETTNSVEIYDPTQNTWSLAAPIPSGGGGYAATRLLHGRIFVSGGDANGTQVFVYDPNFNTWTTMAPMLTWRTWHTAATLPNGNVLIAGGDNGGVSALGSSEIYNPLALPNGSSTPAGGVAVGITGVASASLVNGDVWIAGGDTFIWNGNVLCSSGRTAAQLFNYQTNTWTDLSSMVTGRQGPTASLLQSGQILVAGGIQDYCPATSYSIPSTTLAPVAELWIGAGTIQVTTNNAAATFTITGPATYKGNGKSFTAYNAPIGAYTIKYGTVAGFTAPAKKTQALSALGSVSFSGTYVPLSTDGTINVTTNIAAATFTITGLARHNGRGTSSSFLYAPPGQYTISYGSVNGYTSPPDQTQTLSAGGMISFKGTYTPTFVLSVPSLSFFYQVDSGAARPPQGVLVGSGQPIGVDATASTQDGQNWLAVTPAGGTTPVGLSVAVNPAGLLPGTYHGSITLTSPQIMDKDAVIAVTFFVESNSQPLVVIVPGFFGSKLATSTEVVWLSDLAAASLVPPPPSVPDLAMLEYDINGIAKFSLSTSAMTPQGDYGGLFNLNSAPVTLTDPTTLGYALDCPSPSVLIPLYGTSEKCAHNIYVYNSLELMLQNAGYEVLPFPYDWRMDIGNLSEQLNLFVTNLADSHPGRKISLVAHSMGGLIVGEMLRRHASALKNTLGPIITLGAPFAGSLDTYLYLRGWQAFQPMTKAQTKEYGGNWTSAYELLPRWNFLSIDGTSISYDSVYRGTYSEVFPELPRAANALPLAYSLWEVSMTIPLYDKAYAIVGSGQATDYYMAEDTSGCPVVVYLNGDGTVPLQSAGASSWISAANVRYVNSDHVGLPQSAAVQGAILRILRGQPPSNLSGTPYDVTSKPPSACLTQ